MSVHGRIVFGQRLEEVHHIHDIGENLDSGLNHRRDFLQIQILMNRLLQVRLGHLIEAVEIHGLDVFAVHPFQLGVIEHRRGFGHVMIVKLPDQLVHGHDLLVVLRAPAEKGHEVHDGFGQKSLIQKILIGGMAAALGQLVMLLIRDQRAVHINGHLPAEGLIQTVILRRGRKVFISPHHMGDSHEMVVHHVSKIVGGVAVGLDQDHVIQFRVFHRNVSVNLIMEGGGSFRGIVLTDHVGHARRKLRFHLFLRQMQAVLVIHVDLLARNRTGEGGKALLIAEAVIGLSLFDQLFGIFQIDALLLTFALHIGAHAAVLVRSLVMDESRLLKGSVDDVHGSLHISFLVRILNAQDEIAAFMLGDQIRIQRGTQISHMHSARGTGCKTCSYFHSHRFLSGPPGFIPAGVIYASV